MSLNKLKLQKYKFSKSIIPLAKESFWIFIGNILNISASIVLVKNITENIHPIIYGEFSYTNSIDVKIDSRGFSCCKPSSIL